jgi:hypothetical protein
MNRRPDYPQPRTADNSKTKVFAKTSEQTGKPAATKRVPPIRSSELDIKPASMEQTIGKELDRNESRGNEQTKPQDPTAKEKKRGLFGKKKDSDLPDDEYFE